MNQDSFFGTLPVFTRFEGVTDEANYRPLPEDWYLALADIVGSTHAIAAGRYKMVNLAGASVISAVLNVLDRGDYPFAFGGDGACVAIPPAGFEKVREALATVRSWVADDLQLNLRVALVPMRDIRAQGLDVRVARFGVNEFVSYAMFAGGGTSWAERQMKDGNYGLPPAPAGLRPDLTGLSCRWNPISARNGEIVSVIAVPDRHGNGAEFQHLVTEIIAIAAEQNREGHPIPVDGPELAITLNGVDVEAKATGRPGLRLLRKLAITGQIVLTVMLHRLGMVLGTFDARRYRSDVAANSDFRKFDDGLKMTVDLDASHLARLENLLHQAEAAGICRYGLHRQASALMTCFVPTPLSNDHMHFIDGASGGYAVAASVLSGKTRDKAGVEQIPDQRSATIDGPA